MARFVPGREGIGDIEPGLRSRELGMLMRTILDKGARHEGLATGTLAAGVWGLYWSIYASQYSLIELLDGAEPWLYWLVPLLGMFLSGLLVTRGLAVLKKPQSGPIPSAGPRGAVIDHEDKRGEQELLEAIERHGEITPARAALETTLSVAEADRMLSELAKNGHIEVRARDGRLGYALWEHDRRELTG